jgi:hypothetical protein
MSNLTSQNGFARMNNASPATINEMIKKKSPGIILQGKKIIVDKSLEACRAYGLLKNSKLIWGSNGTRANENNHGIDRQSTENDRKPGRENKTAGRTTGRDSGGGNWVNGGTPGPDSGCNGEVDLGELIIQEKQERIKKLRIDNEKEEGKLVYIEELESEWFTLARRTRDSLLSIPARIAMKLVGKSAHEIEMALTEEIKFSLTNLPDEQPEPKE